MIDQHIDPHAPTSTGIFGLPADEGRSRLVYLPVPWDVTTSYRPGTAQGPMAIKAASDQIDYFDLDFPGLYREGLFMRDENPEVVQKNLFFRSMAAKVIAASVPGVALSPALQTQVAQINEASEWLNEWIYQNFRELFKQNKIPILVGGDHSTPFGAIKAYAEHFGEMGILHIDAHSDTRAAYMGFIHSHASIMYNISESIKNVTSIVQVGIRDFCEDEFLYTQNNSKFSVFFDQDLQREKLRGKPFSETVSRIISKLPAKVYLSFDIDGLNPQYCPNTGTPVPGGIDFNEVLFLIKEVIHSGRQFIGFDLVEIAPCPQGHNEWDANVGMRLLYKLSMATLSNRR